MNHNPTKYLVLVLLTAAVTITDNCYGWGTAKGATGAPCPPRVTTTSVVRAPVFRSPATIRPTQVVGPQRFTVITTQQAAAQQAAAQQAALAARRQRDQLLALQQQRLAAARQPTTLTTSEPQGQAADEQNQRRESSLTPEQQAAIEAMQQRALAQMNPQQRQQWANALNRIAKDQLSPAQKLALDLLKRQGI